MFSTWSLQKNSLLTPALDESTCNLSDRVESENIYTEKIKIPSNFPSLRKAAPLLQLTGVVSTSLPPAFLLQSKDLKLGELTGDN